MGEGFNDEAANGRFGGAISLRDGIERAAGVLVLGGESGSEKGKDGFARDIGEPSHEGGEIHGSHALGFPVRMRRAGGPAYPPSAISLGPNQPGAGTSPHESLF